MRRRIEDLDLSEDGIAAAVEVRVAADDRDLAVRHQIRRVSRSRIQQRPRPFRNGECAVRRIVELRCPRSGLVLTADDEDLAALGAAVEERGRVNRARHAHRSGRRERSGRHREDFRCVAAVPSAGHENLTDAERRRRVLRTRRLHRNQRGRRAGIEIEHFRVDERRARKSGVAANHENVRRVEQRRRVLESRREQRADLPERSC